MHNICIVAGARPNFMKVAPIVRAIQRCPHKDAIAYRLVYVGRQEDNTLETTLYDDLQIPPPDTFLNIEETNLNALTGQVMYAFEHYLEQYPADVVIVVDDLASTMAVAIVAKKKGLRLAHLVAGTRSFDIAMPKEINRIVIDGLSDYLFTAGEAANNIVFREGVKETKVYTVGNILIDTLRHNKPRQQKPAIVKQMEEEGQSRYLVLTLNRKALLHDPEKLQPLLHIIAAESEHSPVVAPLRQEAKEVVEKALGNTRHRIHIVPPLPYLQFAYLTAHATGIVTDSGNVAEEATFYRVPCATLSAYTEHIETVTIGTNVLIEEDPQRLQEAIRQMATHTWKPSALPEKWDGRTAERILQVLIRDAEKNNNTNNKAI